MSSARKSEAIFFTLDDVRLLRDFPDEVSLKIQVRKIEEKTGVFSISLFHYAWGTPFGGNAERFRRHPSASTGFTVEYGLYDLLQSPHT